MNCRSVDLTTSSRRHNLPSSERYIVRALLPPHRQISTEQRHDDVNDMGGIGVVAFRLDKVVHFGQNSLECWHAALHSD
jgi:hypothetical protein